MTHHAAHSPLCRFSVWLIVALSCAVTSASYLRPDLENIPVERLIENIEQKVKDDPENVYLLINLGRVYAMSYANKNHEFQIRKNRDQSLIDDQAWFGYEHARMPWVGSLDPESTEGLPAKTNLHNAIEAFEKAIEIDGENLTAKLSLGWCHDQDDNEEDCIQLYREVIAKGWAIEKEKNVFGLGYRSFVIEASQYLKPKLDAEEDAEEIRELDERIEKLKTIPRPITPLAVGLHKDASIQDVANPSARVQFDADGTGLKKDWSWISSQGAWLVFDKKQNGKIDSALQLFGNVTFHCFWENGYDALAALDNNGDQILTDQELEYLAIWQDSNGDGLSDESELRSVGQMGIVGIQCRTHRLNVSESWRKHCQLWNPQGVILENGETLPTYDIILHEHRSESANTERSLSNERQK